MTEWGQKVLFLRLSAMFWFFENWRCLMDATASKVTRVATGWGLLTAVNWVFDNPLYVTVIALKGLIVGGSIMTVAAIAMNTVILIVYEWRKRNGVDYLGMEDADDVRDKIVTKIERYESARFFTKAILYVPVTIAKIFLWLLNKSDRVSFLALSLYDPFITLAYIRRGKVGHLSWYDWLLFVISNGIANLYWSLRNYFFILIAGIVWGMRDALIMIENDIVHFLYLLFAFGCS